MPHRLSHKHPIPISQLCLVNTVCQLVLVLLHSTQLPVHIAEPLQLENCAKLCLCYGQDEKGLPPTPDTLNLGCTYHLHSSHRFLSTWGAVTMLEKKKENLLYNMALSTYKKKNALYNATVQGLYKSWAVQRTQLDILYQANVLEEYYWKPVRNSNSDLRMGTLPGGVADQISQSQLPFFRRLTNVSQRLCMASLAPKELRYSAL